MSYHKPLLETAEEYLLRRTVQDAINSFDLAEGAACDPDSCAAGRWVCYMLLGHFEKAWIESDAIARRNNPDPNRYWDGALFAGRRVLIRCLHGLGDTLQFLRYAPMVRKTAAFLAIETQPALKSLILCSQLADQVLTWGELEPDWDQQIEVMELPRAFRSTLQSIPAAVPYLHPCSSWPQDSKEDPFLRVGLVWASSTFNPQRSIGLDALEPLFSAPEVRFYNLQVGPESQQAKRCSISLPRLCEEGTDILHLAALLHRLDLVITVDTMMAHLAGALALPVWTLLPYEGDWRWMLHRDDSPWYPTMRLFRQREPGNWAPVVRDLDLALKALLTRRSVLVPEG